MANVDMSGKTVLVTGGNSGIGRHTVIGLARMGAKVVFTSRNLRKGDVTRAQLRELLGSQLVDCMELDLASFASIEAFAKQFLARHPRLDVLILNAGLILDERRETAEGFEMTFGVNHLGHFYLTELLRERLEASAPARVVVVSSMMHESVPGLDFDDLMATRAYSASKVYSASKLANLYFASELAERLEGVTVNALHPGAVRTNLGLEGDLSKLSSRLLNSLLRLFSISPERGARTSIYLASAPELAGETGGYYIKSRRVEPSAAARDAAAASRLWELSEALVEEGKAKPRADPKAKAKTGHRRPL